MRLAWASAELSRTGTLMGLVGLVGEGGAEESLSGGDLATGDGKGEQKEEVEEVGDGGPEENPDDTGDTGDGGADEAGDEHVEEDVDDGETGKTGVGLMGIGEGNTLAGLDDSNDGNDDMSDGDAACRLDDVDAEGDDDDDDDDLEAVVLEDELRCLELGADVESCSCTNIMWSPSLIARVSGALPDKKSFTCNKHELQVLASLLLL